MRNTPEPGSPELVAVGKTIRRHRKALGLSLTDSRLATGISTATMSRIENGKSPDVTLATLMLISRALRINPAELTAPFFSTGTEQEAA